MAIKQLDNLVSTGKLRAEPPAKDELDGMIASGRARLADAERIELSFESRFDPAVARRGGPADQNQNGQVGSVVTLTSSTNASLSANGVEQLAWGP